MNNNPPIDVLIIDDLPTDHLMLIQHAKNCELTYKAFHSGLKALEYVQEQHDSGKPLPRGFISDMKTTNNMDDEEELASPLQLFNYLKSLGKVEFFCFCTGNVSANDEKVEEETGARMIKKGNHGEMQEFFQSLKNAK